MGNVKDRLPKLPTEGNALSPDARKRTITPINKLTPNQIRGNNPPTCFVIDSINVGRITYDLVANDEFHNAYMVTCKPLPAWRGKLVPPKSYDYIFERGMLYYWKKPSSKQAEIAELLLIEPQKKWGDSLIITRLDEWKYRTLNWILEAMREIRDADGYAIHFGETFQHPDLGKISSDAAGLLSETERELRYGESSGYGNC